MGIFWIITDTNCRLLWDSVSASPQGSALLCRISAVDYLTPYCCRADIVLYKAAGNHSTGWKAQSAAHDSWSWQEFYPSLQGGWGHLVFRLLVIQQHLHAAE